MIETFVNNLLPSTKGDMILTTITSIIILIVFVNWIVMIIRSIIEGK